MSPTKYDIMQTNKMNNSLWGRRRRGHSSITAVKKPSIVQNYWAQNNNIIERNIFVIQLRKRALDLCYITRKALHSK